ncbi:MAG TPA: hypothetical protein PK167_03465 [Prolixibacteraceae bacterium]|nr:hypothetical protein [Prolixibacteraceae bacterium]
MKHDLIEISGTDFRIEFNWNAISNFIETEGLSLSKIDQLDNLTPSQITRLIHAGICEGCRLDGVKFPYSANDLGAALGVEEVAAVLKIYQAHTTAKNSTVKPGKKKAGIFQKR